jgi:hypothetical protein
MVRFLLAAAAAFLIFLRAAARCFALAIEFPFGFLEDYSASLGLRGKKFSLF